MAFISKEHIYRLKTYHRAMDKPTCPACGHKHRFSEYIDTRTGMPVGEGVGKCDRINNCGYWLTPYEYFKQYPEARYHNISPAYSMPKPVEQPLFYLPQNVIEQYGNSFMDSNFGKWLATKAPSPKMLENAAEMYRLTSTSTKAIIFWYINKYGTKLYQRGGRKDIFSPAVAAFTDALQEQLLFFFQKQLTDMFTDGFQGFGNSELSITNN